MAASFKGWGSSWLQTWDRITDPNAMYGNASVRVSATGTLTAITIEIVKEEPTKNLTKSSETSTYKKLEEARRIKVKKQRALLLEQDDQLATDFIVALVTKGFLNVC